MTDGRTTKSLLYRRLYWMINWNAKSMIDAIDLQCFSRDVVLEGSTLFRNSRSTGCDSNFDINVFNLGTCVSIVCLLRECMEVWFLGGSQIVTRIANILWWESYMNCLNLMETLKILKALVQYSYKIGIWDYEIVSF